MKYTQPFQFEHNGATFSGTIDFGWVKLVREGPKLDYRGRIIGWYSRITDSDGRNEILEPPEVLVYEKEWREKLVKWWKNLTNQREEARNDDCM